MSEEIKTPDGIPLPHTTEFEDNGPGKNSTKIEVDMEKNAPFIKEVKARLDAANDPEVAKKIEEEFLAATGIPFATTIKPRGSDSRAAHCRSTGSFPVMTARWNLSASALRMSPSKRWIG